MPNTILLEDQLDDTITEIVTIHAKCAGLYEAIADLVRDFADDHSCKPDRTLEHIEDALADLLDDATGPAERRKVRLEDEISNVEWLDERRSSPMVL